MLKFGSAVQDGRPTRQAIIACEKCGQVVSFRMNTFAHCTPSDLKMREQKFVKRRLEEHGWTIGKKDSLHQCPDCGAREIENKEKVVTLHPPKVEAVPPREMSREERRIIFEKLNDNYVGEKVGYAPGWTDAKVALDLGVPRAWVTKIREDMFGPEGSSEEMRATIVEAKTLLLEIRTLAEPLKSLLGKADAIEKRLLQIEKDLRS